MNHLTRIRTTIFSTLAVVCLLAPVFAQAQDPIGRVIRTQGLVTGVDPAGNERPLVRGSNVRLDETIITGPSGSAQLRLEDGALITLQENSLFTINEFDFDGAGGAADSVIMTMTEGAMRTITGIIGEDPADIYELNTQFASIGVRGTEYGVIVEPGGRVRVVVFDGSISVAPSGGGVPTIVGLQGDSDAVDVEDNATVVELDEVPPEVQAIVDTVVEIVNDAEVQALPSDEIAVEVQRQVIQRQQDQQQQQQQDRQPGDENASGALVDVQGNVRVVTTENELNQARVIVVISVSENDPNAFDPRTKVTVSPN